MDLLSVDLTLKCRDARKILVLTSGYYRSIIGASRSAITRRVLTITSTHDLCLNVLIAPHFELFQHHLLLVGVDDKLLDILGEHRQSLVLLRIGEPPSKFDVLWIDHNRVLLSTRSAPSARLQTLSLIEAGTSTVHFTLLGEACHECWAEHFVLLRTNLTPRVLEDLLGSEASFRRLMEQLLEEEACWRRDMVWEL